MGRVVPEYGRSSLAGSSPTSFRLALVRRAPLRRGRLCRGDRAVRPQSAVMGIVDPRLGCSGPVGAPRCGRGGPSGGSSRGADVVRPGVEAGLSAGLAHLVVCPSGSLCRGCGGPPIASRPGGDGARRRHDGGRSTWTSTSTRPPPRSSSPARGRSDARGTSAALRWTDALAAAGLSGSGCRSPAHRQHAGGPQRCEHPGPHGPDGSRLGAGGSHLSARHIGGGARIAAALNDELAGKDGDGTLDETTHDRRFVESVSRSTRGRRGAGDGTRYPAWCDCR